MPRKKATSQPLGVMLGIAQQDKEAILRVLDGLPPIAYWVQCKTDDQAEHYRKLKQGYQFLKEELQRYFGGQGSKLPYLSESDRNFFGAMRDRYIAWYAVVQVGWKHVEDELQSIGLTPEDIKASSPGEALIRVLENECAGFMQSAFIPYERYSPSQDRKLATMQRKIRRGTADEKEIKRYNTQTNQSFSEGARFFAFTEKMIDICEKRSAKDKPLKQAIKTYRRALAELDREIGCQHHKSKGRKGFEWKNGEKSELARG